MNDPVEIELKLDYDPADRERLLASPLLGPDKSRKRRLAATYFDTPDLALAKAGFAVRIRKEGRKLIQTVKASESKSAGLFVRGEWEKPITGDRPIFDETSGPLNQIVDAATLAKVAPIFLTDVDRVAGPIERGGALIEYAVDSGEVRAGKRSAPLSEIEFEIQRGSPQILFDLARSLNDEVPLRLGVRSKSARGYALVKGALSSAIKAEPVDLDRDMSAGDAFTAIAGACLRQYRLNEDLLLHTGAPEAVHQARVGLRRLRSAFWLFAPLFAGDARAAVLAAELRWLAGELGAIRDIDVLLPRIEGADRTALASIRERHFDHVCTLLHSSRVRMLPIELTEWLAIDLRQGTSTDPHPCDQPALAFVGKRLDRLRKRIKREGQKLAAIDDEHRHSVRKDAKKLRYAVEFFVALYPGRKARRRLDRLLDRLEALQDNLGRLNDAAAAPALLTRLQLDVTLPALGRKTRGRLLADAEDCFEALIDTKRFWRT